MEDKKIKIGTRVTYRTSFGTGIHQEAEVTAINDWNPITKEEKSYNSVSLDEKEAYCFTLSNGRWCYGSQIDAVLDDDNEDEEIEVRFDFRCKLYIKGKTIEDIKAEWESMPLFSSEAIDHYADFCELISAKRVDSCAMGANDLTDRLG